MQFYAHCLKGAYRNIYPSEFQVKMCGSHPVIPIIVTITEDGGYHGWLHPDGRVSMIYDSLILLQMCFPYGIAAAIEAKKGRPVQLTIREGVEND